MGALLNQLPTPKKQPAKATRPSKLNQYGRDPQTASERLRASSDYADPGDSYEKQKGYAPLFHAFLADWGRISSGHIADMLFMFVLCKSLGRGAQKGKPRPSCTLEFAIEDAAQVVDPKAKVPPVRSVERELARWQEEKIAIVKREGKGMVSVELLFRGWEELPNYQSAAPVEMPLPDTDIAVDPESVDETKPGNQRVTGKRPVRLAAGSVSKVFPVSCGVRSFRHKSEGVVDLEFSCVIQAGELLVVSKVPDDLAAKLEKENGRSNGINENTSFPRHGCRGENEAIPSNAGRVIPTKKTVEHPRAAELVQLFDPMLARSGSRLLSGDNESLKAACAAVGDCEHNFLVKIAVERAARPLASPVVVSKICSDAVASWKTSKVLDKAGLPLAGDSKKKGFADSVKAEARRRFEKYGKI